MLPSLHVSLHYVLKLLFSGEEAKQFFFFPFFVHLVNRGSPAVTGRPDKFDLVLGEVYKLRLRVYPEPTSGSLMLFESVFSAAVLGPGMWWWPGEGSHNSPFP